MKKIIARFNEGSTDKVKEFAAAFQGIAFLDLGIRELVLYLSDGEVDGVVNDLHGLLDLRYKDNLIEVQTPDFIVSTFLDRSSDRSAGSQRTPVEKLIDQTKRYTVMDYGKMSLTSVAALIAMMGLYMNNVAIIIGAMLLSPLLGPIYGFAVNTGVGKIESAARAIGVLLTLLAAAILIVFVFTVLAKSVFHLPMTPEIQSRLQFNTLYIPLGILLGFASMLAMGRDVSEIFAGVAISVALVPPAAVTGIMLATDPSMAIVPFVIVAQNALGMMVGALVSIMVLKIGPRKYYAKAVARKYIVRILVIAGSLLAITVLADFLTVV